MSERDKPNHIFVDTNVLVGGYSGDSRFQKDADCLHYLYSLTGRNAASSLRTTTRTTVFSTTSVSSSRTE